MKIYICASKHLYGHIDAIKTELEKRGDSIILPNSYDNPLREQEFHAIGAKEHSEWKGRMIREQKDKVNSCDVILVLNMEKNGQKNYIGGATFLEVYMAFDVGKKIFFYNPLPEGMLKDELLGMECIVINGDLSLVK